MASISTDPRGNRAIQFVASDGKRRSIRLGQTPIRVVEQVRRRVEVIEASKRVGLPLDPEMIQWLASIGDELHDKLVRVGLAEERKSARLGEFLTRYIDSRTDLKPGPLANLGYARDRVLDFFDASMPLQNLTAADADRWVVVLKSRYAPATVAKSIKTARQFYSAAVREGLCTGNPFGHLKPGSMANPERFVFVSEEMTRKILDACPCAEWRAIVALARYGGLRTPSETLALTWADVSWDGGWLRVASTKTGQRRVPLFPELRLILEELFDAAPEGSVHLINRYRCDRQNLRTQLQRIFLKAGLDPTEKAFQNMRSSRETELMETYPAFKVVAWIGNSQRVAQKHYLQIRDEDFIKASQPAVQKAVQSGYEKGCQGVHSDQRQNPDVL